MWHSGMGDNGGRSKGGFLCPRISVTLKACLAGGAHCSSTAAILKRKNAPRGEIDLARKETRLAPREARVQKSFIVLAPTEVVLQEFSVVLPQKEIVLQKSFIDVVPSETRLQNFFAVLPRKEVVLQKSFINVAPSETRLQNFFVVLAQNDSHLVPSCSDLAKCFIDPAPAPSPLPLFSSSRHQQLAKCTFPAVHSAFCFGNLLADSRMPSVFGSVIPSIPRRRARWAAVVR